MRKLGLIATLPVVAIALTSCSSFNEVSRDEFTKQVTTNAAREDTPVYTSVTVTTKVESLKVSGDSTIVAILELGLGLGNIKEGDTNTANYKIDSYQAQAFNAANVGTPDVGVTQKYFIGANGTLKVTLNGTQTTEEEGVNMSENLDGFVVFNEFNWATESWQDSTAEGEINVLGVIGKAKVHLAVKQTFEYATN